LEEVHNEKDDDVMEKVPPAWRWIAAFLQRKNLFFSSEEIFQEKTFSFLPKKFFLRDAMSAPLINGNCLVFFQPTIKFIYT